MTSSVADSLVGRVIDGRYRIISHLADGGMASVYVAMDARLHREVALKIMRPGLALDHVFVERFRGEARSAASLSHPNVVAVYDQGEDDGDVFLAMELVTGKTLRDVIHEEAPLTARESLAILEPILAALRAAHSAGIIHRDVKPENVIVRHDGEVKVADFGLARAIANQTTTSQTGVLLGTVSYLSPEQVERGAADQRSDVYAAGLLLFEMLTGRKAVTGDTPIQIAYKHVHGGVPAPSSVVATVLPELDELVAQATAVEPDDRFASAADFIAALRGVRRRLTPVELDRRGTVGGQLPAPADRTLPDAVGRADLNRTTALPLSEVAQPHGRPHAPAPTPAVSAAGGSGSGATPTKRARRRRTWPAWVAALLLVAGGGGGWWFTAGPGGTTRVPSVVNQSFETASTRLDESSLQTDSSEAFSETVAKGTVISARPQPGTEVSKRSTVLLVVSKGPERYDVPTLIDTKANAAAATLAKFTLTLGEVHQDWSETVPKGVVISQKPAPGESVKRGTLVAMVVSRGRQPITVPTLTGLTVEVATKKLTDLGLKPKRDADANSDTVPAGQVISQTPAKGTLFRDAEVSFVVSKGPVMVAVPNLLGQHADVAEKALKDLGFAVKIDRPLGQFFELVRDQSVPGGQSAPKGSTITLTVV